MAGVGERVDRAGRAQALALLMPGDQFTCRQVLEGGVERRLLKVDYSAKVAALVEMAQHLVAVRRSALEQPENGVLAGSKSRVLGHRADHSR
jgi:hypothetical protein